MSLERTTVHLFVHERHGRGEESGTPQEGAERFTLSVELQSLGPVRADLSLTATDLRVRLSAERPDVAARFANDAEDLAGRLNFGGRRVILVAGRAPVGELDLERRAHDVRYLRDRNVMDLSG